MQATVPQYRNQNGYGKIVLVSQICLVLLLLAGSLLRVPVCQCGLEMDTNLREDWRSITQAFSLWRVAIKTIKTLNRRWPKVRIFANQLHLPWVNTRFASKHECASRCFQPKKSLALQWLWNLRGHSSVSPSLVWTGEEIIPVIRTGNWFQTGLSSGWWEAGSLLPRMPPGRDNSGITALPLSCSCHIHRDIDMMPWCQAALVNGDIIISSMVEGSSFLPIILTLLTQFSLTLLLQFD